MKGRYLFRAAVRLVLEYMEWITEVPITEEISDDVTINIKMAYQKQKIEKKLLTLQVKYIICIKKKILYKIVIYKMW